MQALFKILFYFILFCLENLNEVILKLKMDSKGGGGVCSWTSLTAGAITQMRCVDLDQQLKECKDCRVISWALGSL